MTEEFERTTAIPIDTSKAPDLSIGVDFHFTRSGPITSGKYLATIEPTRPGLLCFRWPVPKRRADLPTQLILHHLDISPRLLFTRWCAYDKRKRVPPPPPGSATASADHFAERERRIRAATTPGDLRTKALAMCEFDRSTDPDQLRPKLARLVRELTIYLRFRWLQRAAWGVQDREFEPIARQDEGVRETAVAVEKVARRALLRAFPRRDDPTAVNLRLLEATMAAFVAGELRMTLFDPPAPPTPDPLMDDGIPDGDYYFSFAESGLLFVRLGLHAAFWQKVLPIFVCGDGFFASHFWNRKHRCRDAYRPAFCKPDAAVSSTAILVWHEQRIRPMTLAQLAAEHTRAVGLALRNDRARPSAVCTAKEFQ